MVIAQKDEMPTNPEGKRVGHLEKNNTSIRYWLELKNYSACGRRQGNLVEANPC